nr:Pro-Pol polyprotein [Tanacetum cinerariifolium]
MGPFPSSKGNKYNLIAVDYLSKWVKAKALPTNDARVVVKFLKSLFSRFGTPKAIISDRGTHFCNDQFSRVMAKYGITHRLSTAYHPKTSGQVEVTNRGLKRILKRTAYENSLIYKERTKKLHVDKIKNRIFNVGDQVLLFNSKLKIFSGKLKSRWSGPFTISKIYPYRTAKLIHPDGCNFKVNCHRLKHYHGGDPPPLEIPDDYPPMVEDFLCRILSWFSRPSLMRTPSSIKNELRSFMMTRSKTAFSMLVIKCCFLIPDSRFSQMVAISKLIVIDSSTIMEETHHRWRFRMLPLSLRTTEYRDRDYPPKIEDFLCRILSWFSRPS